MTTLHAVERGSMSTRHERLQNQPDTLSLGTADCPLRIAGGLAMTAVAVDGSIGAWGYLGLLFLVTVAAWVCPFHRWLALNTARSHP